MEGRGTVCVTGGTGYIASWLIMRLLERGYSVRATLRFNPSDDHSKRDISYLTNLPEASKKLRLFHADLNDPDSFKPAIEGCIGVFHLAHPTDVDGNEPEEVVTERAVKAALGILKASLNSKTVKRFVYASSAATVLFNEQVLHLYDSGSTTSISGSCAISDENSWSDVDICRNIKLGISSSYLVSKTITEKTVLEFGEKHDDHADDAFDVVSLVLPLVVGPFICPNLPLSVYLALAMIFGDRDQYKFLIDSKLVHIDDVARAQIFLLENPNTKGRYICSSTQITIHQMYEHLSTRYPQFQIPFTQNLKEIYKVVGKSNLSSKKLMDSGFKFTYGLNEMFDGAIECCKQKGFLK